MPPEAGPFFLRLPVLRTTARWFFLIIIQFIVFLGIKALLCLVDQLELPQCGIEPLRRIKVKVLA